MAEKTQTAEAYYKDYWVDEAKARDERAYYQRLYAHLKHRLIPEKPQNLKILDVAGGNGQFSAYLGLPMVDVLDISPSGLEAAKKYGFNTIQGNVEERFPVQPNTYDLAYCFEVLEHLHYPNKTLAEINNVLKPGGRILVGQPNMKPDGVHHVRRYRFGELKDDLKKAGFAIQWVDYVPAYSMRDAILSDIRRNPSWVRKIIQCVNLTLSLLPWPIRYQMAKMVPDRFALLFIVSAIKKQLS